jgi:S1-C subfamily serine protease
MLFALRALGDAMISLLSEKLRPLGGASLAALIAFIPCAAGAAVVGNLRPPPRPNLIAVADRQHMQVVKLRSRALIAQRGEAGTVTMEVFGSEASGVLVGEGFVLTALHLVALLEADGGLKAVEDIEVLVPGRGAFPAELAGGVPELDIAVLDVSALRDLPGAELAAIDPEVGDSLIALGAVGDDVEAVGVTVQDVGSLDGAAIKIDTAPALATSFAGGPLFNDEGQVVALITPMAAEDGAAVTAAMLGQLLAKTRRDRSMGGLPADGAPADAAPADAAPTPKP